MVFEVPGPSLPPTGNRLGGNKPPRWALRKIEEDILVANVSLALWLKVPLPPGEEEDPLRRAE